MELVRVDRREVLLGAEAGHVDGVLAVGEDLLVPARSLVALAPRVRRTLREPRGAALVVLALVALGRRPVFSSSERTTRTPSTRDAIDDEERSKREAVPSPTRRDTPSTTRHKINASFVRQGE